MKTQSVVNYALIITGTLLVMIGLFRASPVTVNKSFLWSNIPPIIALVVMIAMAWYVGGMKAIVAGVEGTTRTTSTFMITLVSLMPLIAFGSVVAHHFEKPIAEALSGKTGFLWTIISAFTAPGGNTFSGIVNKLWAEHRELHPQLLYFMSVVPLVSFTIFVIRRLGLSAEIAITMYKVNWAIALLLAPVFWIYQRFFFK